jgi:hypothetical protein
MVTPAEKNEITEEEEGIELRNFSYLLNVTEIQNVTFLANISRYLQPSNLQCQLSTLNFTILN